MHSLLTKVKRDAGDYLVWVAHLGYLWLWVFAFESKTLLGPAVAGAFGLSAVASLWISHRRSPESALGVAFVSLGLFGLVIGAAIAACLK